MFLPGVSQKYWRKRQYFWVKYVLINRWHNGDNSIPIRMYAMYKRHGDNIAIRIYTM